jgi:predicted aspartyl protease
MTFGFDPSQDLIIVPVRLFGPVGDMIVRLALDTGATSTVDKLGNHGPLGYNPATSPHRIQVTTGSGVELCPRVTVQRLEALGKVVTDFPILSHTLPPTSQVDGLLGLDFFRGFQISIDFRNGTITIT